MSVYAIGVVVAPILGPTIGGWLTDNYSWRWVFYINIPIGILAVILCSILLEDPAYLKGSRPGKIDFIGFGLLIIWIGCLQVMLDKGQDADWLYSGLIRFLAVAAAVGFCAFIIWELRVAHPIVNLRVLGTTHPFLALKFLTGGELDPVSGLFYSQGRRAKYYKATDNLSAEAYRGLLPEDLIEKMLRDPENVFTTVPQNVMKYASFMHRTGAIEKTPAAWTELFFAEMHAAPGS